MIIQEDYTSEKKEMLLFQIRHNEDGTILTKKILSNLEHSEKDIFIFHHNTYGGVSEILFFTNNINDKLYLEIKEKEIISLFLDRIQENIKLYNYQKRKLIRKYDILINNSKNILKDNYDIVRKNKIDNLIKKHEK